MGSRAVVIVFVVALAGVIGGLGALVAFRQAGQRIEIRAIAPESLPAHDSPGATLLRGYCVQCHALPDPASHRAEEWTDVVARMHRHATARHEHHRPMPGADESRTLLAYLRAHAAAK